MIVVMLSAIVLSVIVLSAIKLCVVMLSVFGLNVVILNVVAPSEFPFFPRKRPNGRKGINNIPICSTFVCS
jgi:hypothetical protein